MLNSSASAKTISRMLPPAMSAPKRLTALRYSPPRCGASSCAMTVPRKEKDFPERLQGRGRFEQGNLILRLDFPRWRGLRCFSCSEPKWWNWQTRHLEGVVGKPVRVQIPPSAPSQFLKGYRRREGGGKGYATVLI